MRIRIKVLNLPELASVFGRRDFPFSFSRENLKDLLQALSEKYGSALDRILQDPGGQWNQSVQIIVRGRLCAQEINPVPLEEGDCLSFVVLLEGVLWGRCQLYQLILLIG
jgi:hypothetical protein